MSSMTLMTEEPRVVEAWKEGANGIQSGIGGDRPCVTWFDQHGAPVRTREREGARAQDSV